MIDPQDRLILETVAKGGLASTDAEVHYQLARRSRPPLPGLEILELLELIAELEHAGLVATALQVRLTDAGKRELAAPPTVDRRPPYAPAQGSSNGRARPRRAIQLPAGRLGPRAAAA